MVMSCVNMNVISLDGQFCFTATPRALGDAISNVTMGKNYWFSSVRSISSITSVFAALSWCVNVHIAHVRDTLIRLRRGMSHGFFHGYLAKINHQLATSSHHFATAYHRLNTEAID